MKNFLRAAAIVALASAVPAPAATVRAAAFVSADSNKERHGAGARGLSQSVSADLGGTSWQLVKFQGGDGQTLVPDDGAKYTLAFGKDGRVSVRLDCNRGGGTWQSAGPNQLRFGPLALTRAMCPNMSLHDRIARDWKFVRSYTLRGGHLFLSLTADGGIYEFEPLGGSRPPASQEARVTGTVSYRQRIALTRRAVVEVKLLEVSRAGARAVTIARQLIRPAGRQVPIAFELRYDPRRIQERRRYVVQARILEGGRLRFISTEAYPVITGGHPDTADIIVRPARR